MSYEDDEEPGGPLMMTRYKGLMTAIIIVLIVGMIGLSVVWVLAWG